MLLNYYHQKTRFETYNNWFRLKKQSNQKPIKNQSLENQDQQKQSENNQNLENQNQMQSAC